MNIDEFKNKLDNLISEAENVIEEMPQKGDKSTDCQKINLIQALNQFQHCVNGTTQEDLTI